MAVTNEEIEFVTDLFSDLGGITTRKMFGGLSVYSDGQIFALIGPQEKLMVKAKDDLADELAAQGSFQFVYSHAGKKPTAMPYWTLPESALDDPEEACEWARKSLKMFA